MRYTVSVMVKEFLKYEQVRNNALKLAHKMYKEDGFVPDVIYCSLRGGAYMANVISEYYKVARKNERPVLYAAVVARSYSDVRKASKRVYVDGWTYHPKNLRPGDKILLVDDIYDSGNTINELVNILYDYGVPAENLKIAVHDYKVRKFKEQPNIVPDYYCRKFVLETPEDDCWINYMSHELVGLTSVELEENFYREYPELRDVLDPIFSQK